MIRLFKEIKHILSVKKRISNPRLVFSHSTKMIPGLWLWFWPCLPYMSLLGCILFVVFSAAALNKTAVFETSCRSYVFLPPVARVSFYHGLPPPHLHIDLNLVYILCSNVTFFLLQQLALTAKCFIPIAWGPMPEWSLGSTYLLQTRNQDHAYTMKNAL